jgi:hypothetical protein
MMKRNVKLVLTVVAAVAVVWLLVIAMKSWYFTPRQAAKVAIQNASNRLDQYRHAQRDHPRIKHEIDSLVNRTLGGDLEMVDHKLRSRLNRLVEHVGLQGATVGTGGAPKAKDSPAKVKFTGTANKPLRDEVDFYELEGWLSGSGTFEQVLQLLASVESEPWLKRIDLLRLDPKDNGERFDVTLRVTTLYLPQRSPDPNRIPPADEPKVERYQALLARQPFRVPPKSAKQQAPEAPAGPAPFPYEQWSLTGIAQSHKGVEVWLLNSQTGQTTHLAIGERLEDAGTPIGQELRMAALVLVATRADVAEFRLGNERFFVPIGKNLGDRVPISQ